MIAKPFVEVEVTRESFLKACEDQKKAKMIEATAKRMKETAREIILAYEVAHQEEFRVAPDSETGKTFEFTPELTDTCGDFTLRITHPTSQPLPSRFDESRADEFVQLLDEAIPEAVNPLFTISYHFKGPTALLDYLKGEGADHTKEIAALLLPYTLPATEAEELSPRVQVK